MQVLLKFVSFVCMQRRQQSWGWSQHGHHIYWSGRYSEAYLLIPLLLPLGDETRIGVPVLQQPVVQLLGDSLFLVVEVVNVP